MSTEIKEKLPLPEYIQTFVELHFAERYVEPVVDEFIDFMSDGRGGSEYTRRVATKLIEAREKGKQPRDLNYYGA